MIKVWGCAEILPSKLVTFFPESRNCHAWTFWDSYRKTILWDLLSPFFNSYLGVLQSHQGCERVSSPKLMVVCINVLLLRNVTRTLVTLCKKEDFSVMLEFDWWQGSIFPIVWSSQTTTILYGQLRWLSKVALRLSEILLNHKIFSKILIWFIHFPRVLITSLIHLKLLE